MRSVCRTVSPHTALPGAVLRRIIALAFAVGVVGLSFGVYATEVRVTGMSLALICAMSMLVFAGGSQFAFVSVLAGGGSVGAAVVSALLLNARYVAFGASLSPWLRRSGWVEAWLAPHMLIDESAALALAQPDERLRVRAYWACGILCFAAWNVGTLLGGWLGASTLDARMLGLDGAVGAAFLAILASLMRDMCARVAAFAGAAIAFSLLPFVPTGLSVALAAAGAAMALLLPQPPRNGLRDRVGNGVSDRSSSGVGTRSPGPDAAAPRGATR